MHKLVRKEALPVDIQLLLLDSMIEKIFIHGSEVWGYENLKFIEQIHLKYCKRVLQVRNTTPNFMVLGELGRFPIEVKVKLRMISFWSRLIQSESKLSSILYKLMLFFMNKISKLSNGLNAWSLYLMKLDWDIFFKIRLDTSTRIWISKF